MVHTETPDLEDFQGFHPLDLISSRHLNYLRDKSQIITYSTGQYLFQHHRCATINYYLLDGVAQIDDNNGTVKKISSKIKRHQHSLDKNLAPEASIKALTTCKILQVNKILVEQYFALCTTGTFKAIDPETLCDHQEPENTQWMDTFLKSSLAKNLTEQQAQELLSFFKDIKVREKQLLVSFGEMVKNFFIIKSGCASCVSENGQNRELVEGDYFGDESLIPDAISDIKVTMTSSGAVAALDKEHFNTILKASLIKHIDPRHVDLMDKKSYVILDVRSTAEYKFGHTKNSHNIPVNTLKERIHELDKNVMVLLSEESGERGELATHILQQAGYRAFIIGGQQVLDPQRQAKRA